MANHNFLNLEERLSALADGELAPDEIDGVLDALQANPDLYDIWTLHHSTAASIRGERMQAMSGDLAFWQSLQEQLGNETKYPVPAPGVTESPVSIIGRAPVANEPFWRVRSLASVLAIVTVGGLAAVLWPQSHPVDQAVSVAPPSMPMIEVAASAGGGVMLRDPELDALMAAHQQLGGHSAWQAPSGFLRNATYERSGR